MLVQKEGETEGAKEDHLSTSSGACTSSDSEDGDARHVIDRRLGGIEAFRGDGAQGCHVLAPPTVTKGEAEEGEECEDEEERLRHHRMPPFRSLLTMFVNIGLVCANATINISTTDGYTKRLLHVSLRVTLDLMFVCW